MPDSKFLKTHRLLGKFLVAGGLINDQQLQKGLARSETEGVPLGRALIEMGYVTPRDIWTLINTGFEFKPPRDSGGDTGLLLKNIPETLIKRHKVMPLKKRGNKLVVAMSDVSNVVAIDDLRLITGNEIEPVEVPEPEIKALAKKHYGISNWEKELQDFEIIESEALHLDLPEDDQVNEAPVVRLVNSIIVNAIEERASDIHIEPKEKSVRIRYRVDGVLREVTNNLPRRSRYAIISRVKVLADLNIADKRLPQDGRIKIRYQSRDIDLRVSTMPVAYGEKLVIRILDRENAVLNLTQLGIAEENLKRFKQIINYSHGMVLITGPMGSGKTTTLYATLKELSTVEKNILTVEDPIEFLLGGINQTQVNVKAGLSFASGLRSLVRQDPDIIMVGEIRDPETAAIAVQAANTGHLVFSTMHTGDAAGALLRLTEMGIEPYRIASSVVGVVAQRLVRKICLRCRESYLVSPDNPEFSMWPADGEKDIWLYRGRGCSYCNYTGYRGRISIQEVLPVNTKIRRVLLKRPPAGRLKELALTGGMVTLAEDGRQKASRGITTLREVMRVLPGSE